MRVILVGFMGCGKSSLGKKLANKLNIPFIDSDVKIEEQHQKTIGELFAEHGESYFRNIESKFIDNLGKDQDFVLATGGGMPCYHDNMRKLNLLGTTVYLKRSPKELANRLKNAKKQRPIIAGLSEAELPDFIESKLNQREAYYSMSELILDRDQQDPQTLKELLSK